IKNEGVPVVNSTRKGDLYIKILVQVPQKMSLKQKELLEEFSRLDNATTSPQPVPLSTLN
ncbi:molecular chaperone DnaJ, partial [bacterium]|nr:molecular chaperone DnaJ [bacterium]